jgi:hypothetical protein
MWADCLARDMLATSAKSSDMKRGCDVAVVNSCNLAITVDNLGGEYMYL